MSEPIEQKQVVGAVIYNRHGEILLQQRDDKPGLPYAGHWTFFGGAVEAGETPDDAIVRELQEELELTLPLRYWQQYVCPARTIPDKVVTTNTLFVSQLEREQTPTVLHEGQAMRWFDAESAQSLELAFMQSPYLMEAFALLPQWLASTQETSES
jgi:8-oxo-dGTP diphosphatase